MDPEPQDDEQEPEPVPDDELFATRAEWREHPDG